MQKELVSIITPMYNAEKFIAETIDSVVRQEYTNWEMIIIDDGSMDSSQEIVFRYTQIDTRILLVSQINKGSAAARNNGIRRARGQYIALLDADDLWDNTFLSSQLQLMKEKKAQLVYASHRRINANSEECLPPFIVPEKVSYTDLLRTCSISCLTGLYDTEKFGKVYLREELRSLRDDFVYWLEIIKKVKVAYGNTKVIASYRVLENSASRKKKRVIKPQFLVYYKIEKLGLIRSLYYLCHWAVNGYVKYK